MIPAAQIADFQRDGVVKVEGLFADWVDVMTAGVARNLAEPREYASENEVTKGRFFDDYSVKRRVKRDQISA
ncbi:MAG: hypothetical protein COB39_11655 [Marinosulfonomonas sp.]|nr:MAG: hypothetical protein COB39_11655 [Marinosulfonomonas sp.]